MSLDTIFVDPAIGRTAEHLTIWRQHASHESKAVGHTRGSSGTECARDLPAARDFAGVGLRTHAAWEAPEREARRSTAHSRPVGRRDPRTPWHLGFRQTVPSPSPYEQRRRDVEARRSCPCDPGHRRGARGSTREETPGRHMGGTCAVRRACPGPIPDVLGFGGPALGAMKVAHPMPGCEAPVCRRDRVAAECRMRDHRYARMPIHGRYLPLCLGRRKSSRVRDAEIARPRPPHG